MKMLNSYLLTALTFTTIVIVSGKPPAPEDIGTNFFLKASKSVPRIGRRTVDYENYFLKASKSIPRIGRRTIESEAQESRDWLSKFYPEPIKRSFIEKYFKGNDQPVWSDLEKVYKVYPTGFQPDDSYPDATTDIKQGQTYWQRTKKSEGNIADVNQPSVE